MKLVVHPSPCLQGILTVPGDKSISHRAVILAAIAQGQSRIHGWLQAADCLATVSILRALGVRIDIVGAEVRVEGVGLHGLRTPTAPLDCGNAGTAMRLFVGLLAGQIFNSVLTGDASLRNRPMARIVEPLRSMGACISGQSRADHDLTAPLIIQGNPALRGIEYSQAVPSAQVKSGILLAGLYAAGETVIIERHRTRDHSERLLERFGADLKITESKIILTPPSFLRAQEISVPGDISSAAFFIVGALLCRDTPKRPVLIKNVGVNPYRAGVITILQAMGAKIVLHPRAAQSYEPVADIEVWGGQKLKGITIDPAWVVSAIDEFPIIFIAAACAQGTTILRSATELRYKESDRIQTMTVALRALGIVVEVLEDGLIIEGGELTGGEVDSAGDHRIAMALAMAACAAKGTIVINDAENIATSFPNFIVLAKNLGLSVYQKE